MFLMSEVPHVHEMGHETATKTVPPSAKNAPPKNASAVPTSPRYYKGTSLIRNCPPLRTTVGP